MLAGQIDHSGPADLSTAGLTCFATPTTVCEYWSSVMTAQPKHPLDGAQRSPQVETVPHPNVIQDEAALADITRGVKVAAVIGMKDDPQAEASLIPRAIEKRGVRVFGVNPRQGS